jgi:hypothetical protein
MIYIFCHPKPWIDVFLGIQHTCIKSWKQLEPTPRIILLGNDEGTEENAKNLNVDHIPDITCNEWGTPLISSIFATIRKHTRPEDIVCYINADIVLTNDFTKTIAVVTNTRKSEWLMVGKRRDLDLPDPNKMTVKQIREECERRGKDHGWAGIDYFVFPQHVFPFVYPFALGKFVWDQWLLGNAFRRGVFTVDASKTVLAVHLNCDWFFRGKLTSNRMEIESSEEGKRNRSFDFYQKTILTGTIAETIETKDKISVNLKDRIVDED